MILNNRGFIAMDFIFAMIIVMGFTGILFALSVTFTTIEITQYITYTSARNYFAGHKNLDSQETLAFEKYKQLVANPVFLPLYSNGWFEIPMDRPDSIGDHTAALLGEAYPTNSKNMFFGASSSFTAKILDFNIPLLGSTTTEGDGSGNSFKTRIGAYMGREVTSSECYNFTTQRWKNLRKFYPAAPSVEGVAVTIHDNGC